MIRALNLPEHRLNPGNNDAPDRAQVSSVKKIFYRGGHFPPLLLRSCCGPGTGEDTCATIQTRHK